ncbi:hypothetical protein [Treponema denticola]|uniref:hypothetical protein n=1 Tax=Treponema denticola TaxID=158 RepID=UPI0002B5945B|nr:hypothetical protein [Treponema denticola]EMB43573.1 hypothetical protein HMPREF9730_02386 [Treponema denticola AL-2]
MVNKKLERWAKLLHGFEYPAENIKKFQNEMAKDEVIAIYGLSDDLLEFKGAMYDERGAWKGFLGRITKDLTVISEIEYLNSKLWNTENLPFIQAIWNPKDLLGNIYSSWKIETDLPHKDFQILEDGKLFCIGIIIDVEDILKKIKGAINT